jgi:hypothetical protein
MQAVNTMHLEIHLAHQMIQMHQVVWEQLLLPPDST